MADKLVQTDFLAHVTLDSLYVKKCDFIIYLFFLIFSLSPIPTCTKDIMLTLCIHLFVEL